MKPSRAASTLSDKICETVSASICYGIDDDVNKQIARLIDEHVKGLIAATDALYDEYPWNDSISSAVVSAFKPWTEPAD